MTSTRGAFNCDSKLSTMSNGFICPDHRVRAASDAQTKSSTRLGWCFRKLCPLSQSWNPGITGHGWMRQGLPSITSSRRLCLHKQLKDFLASPTWTSAAASLLQGARCQPLARSPAWQSRMPAFCIFQALPDWSSSRYKGAPPRLLCLDLRYLSPT